MQTSLTWIELSQAALNHNIAYYKRHTGDAALMAVVKSNAYGHGLISTARMFQQYDAIAGFVTVTLSEAVTLRIHGIIKPILVMGYVDRPLDQIIQYNIHISVSDVSMLCALEQIAHHYKKAITIHLKIDTGLTRFGFMPEEASEIIKKLSTNKAFVLHALCTHFAESSSDDWSYTQLQRQRFMHVVEQLKQHNLLPPFYHADKSSSALRACHAPESGVRIGAGLYGLLPDRQLRQVMTWKTRIAHIRTLTHASPFGYAQTYIAQVGQKIAFIPIGYYDGYDRRLSNCGQVLILHQSAAGIQYINAPVIGRVTMNTLSLDISHARQVNIGDEVIVLGDYPGLRAWDIADVTGGENPRDVIVKIRENIARIWVN